MNALDLVDPELREPLAHLPKLDFSPAHLSQTRALLDAARRQWRQDGQDDVTKRNVTERWIEADGARIRLLIYSPDSAGAEPRPCFLNIHGGAFVMGAPEMDDGENRAFAHELSAVIVSVDYRLAPEHPFPAALNDCHAALHWIVANAPMLSIDADRIAIGGKSAGGGITAGLALKIRDEGKLRLVHQHLIYPMIDDRPPKQPQQGVGAFVLHQQDADLCWAALLGAHAHAPPSHAVAARAGDLSDLPPAFISVGALDLFHDANVEYATRLMTAGVTVERRLYPGAYHGFDLAIHSKLAQAHARHRLHALKRVFGAAA